jgi:hypothetical protein
LIYRLPTFRAQAAERRLVLLP